MAFFRTVSLPDVSPAVAGEGVVLRPPQMSDAAEWVALRAASRDFLVPWEPTWPADDLTRASFRRRIKRYGEDQRCDLAYALFIFRKQDNVLVGGTSPNKWTLGSGVGDDERAQAVDEHNRIISDDRDYVTTFVPMREGLIAALRIR